MDTPTMFEPFQVGQDIDVLPSYFPIPGLGILPTHAFLLRATTPVLIDSGLVPLGDQFMERLSSIIDITDLRWLWLTHTDQDHIGSLLPILEKAPKLKVITTFLGLGKRSLNQPLPMDRVFLLNPGQTIDMGDRTLTAIKPPAFDAPETTGFFDPRSGALFCADCFGTLMSDPVTLAADIKPDDLEEGLLTWAGVDFPWLHMVNEGVFGKVLDDIRRMSPKIILSSHLPPAVDMTERLLGYLAAAPAREPFTGPDQKALEEMIQ